MSPLKDLYLSHQCFPLSFLIAESLLCKVLSRKYATQPATNAFDWNGTLTMSLNCQVHKNISVSKQNEKTNPSLYIILLYYIMLYRSYPYPSSACVDRTKTINCSVLIEVLGHRQAQEDGEA